VARVALTAFENNARVSILVNLLGLDDASAVNLSQAPLGQNGAVLFALEQNPNDLAQWSLIDQTLTATQSNLLATQQLFISANSGEFPNGELRGQLVTDSSVQPPAPDILQVIDIMPAAGEVLDALPGSLVATFNLAVDPQSIGADSVQFSASGGDGSFGEANDLTITPTAINLVDQTLTIDLAGISLDPDVFQLVLNGNGIAPITSAQGSVLDGDADNVSGGDFISSFPVAEPPAVAPSFAERKYLPPTVCRVTAVSPYLADWDYRPRKRSTTLLAWRLPRCQSSFELIRTTQRQAISSTS